MENKVVIEGEASETDSEEEAECGTPSRMVKSVQGAVIAGEDSESDDERDGSVSSAVSALRRQPEEEAGRADTLLHGRLRERNAALALGLRALGEREAGRAARSLAAGEQQLLRSQVALQAAIGSLRQLARHSAALQHRLHHVLASSFFANVLPSAGDTPPPPPDTVQS